MSFGERVALPTSGPEGPNRSPSHGGREIPTFPSPNPVPPEIGYSSGPGRGRRTESERAKRVSAGVTTILHRLVTDPGH